MRPHGSGAPSATSHLADLCRHLDAHLGQAPPHAQEWAEAAHWAQFAVENQDVTAALSALESLAADTTVCSWDEPCPGCTSTVPWCWSARIRHALIDDLWQDPPSRAGRADADRQERGPFATAVAAYPWLDVDSLGRITARTTRESSIDQVLEQGAYALERGSRHGLLIVQVARSYAHRALVRQDRQAWQEARAVVALTPPDRTSAPDVLRSLDRIRDRVGGRFPAPRNPAPQRGGSAPVRPGSRYVLRAGVN